MTPAPREGQRADYLGERAERRVRMPVTLDAELHNMAKREGVPLNTLITTILAGAVGWKPRKRRRPA